MTQPSSLVYLPYEILVSIFSWLAPFDQVILALTCRRLYHVILNSNATPDLKAIFPKCSRNLSTATASSPTSNKSIATMCPRSVAFYDYTNTHIHNNITLLRHLKRMAGPEWRFCCTLQASMFGKDIKGHGCRLLLPTAKRSWYRRLMMELDLVGENALVEMEWRRIQRLRRFRMLGH
ncbi:hypothetical protein DV735_g5546, partial [Chaetothyriales sp. CBS 134920]